MKYWEIIPDNLGEACWSSGWGILLLLLTLLTAHGQNEFTWKDASHNTRNLSDLQEILRKNRQWIESRYRAGARANLRSADLTGADLSGANLSEADLSDANLTKANLTNANLLGANLIRGELYNAILVGSNLLDANLARAIFEPDSLPSAPGIARARHLELLTYVYNPVALVQLRKQFEDGGLRDQEREITYALKRREAESFLQSNNFVSFTFNKVFFDWTCQYGMNPGRPLMLGVLLWFLCSLLYLVCMHTPGEAGLYRVYGQSIRDDPSAQRRVERISPLTATHSSSPRWVFQFFRREGRLLRTSMFFSLMSAFNIGFRDINFGRWLRLLTRQEFDIKAVGWARVIAGWQSLISVYLIALWVLTYFGRPFD